MRMRSWPTSHAPPITPCRSCACLRAAIHAMAGRLDGLEEFGIVSLALRQVLDGRWSRKVMRRRCP